MRAVILDAGTLGNANLDIILDNGDLWQSHIQTTSEQVNERIAEAEIVLTNKVPIDADVIRHNPQIKLIMITATGTNNVDLHAAQDAGIVVANVRGYGSASVAQHTITLMLNLATKMPAYLDDVKAGEWHTRNSVTLIHRPIFELSGKRLGIVGFGQLGQAVAQVAEAFGMEVVLAERSGQQSGQQRGQQRENRVPIDELLPQVDFLSLHCPLDETNRHFINEARLALMSPNSYLINTARGGLVDEHALISALESGSIAGAALDVLPLEPPEQNDVLIQAARRLPNLLITPHNAWGALESRQRLVDQVAEVIRSFKDGSPLNVVTP